MSIEKIGGSTPTNTKAATVKKTKPLPVAQEDRVVREKEASLADLLANSAVFPAYVGTRLNSFG